MKSIALVLILISVWLGTSEAFSSRTVRRAPAAVATDAVNEQQDAYDHDDGSRRKLIKTVSLLSSTWTVSPPASFAASEPAIGSTAENPVAIIGAGGKTGMAVAQALAEAGLYCVTMSRSGRDPFTNVKLKAEVQPFIQHYETGVSVLEKETMEAALKEVHASAIIYCASASRQGGTAFQVDDEGVGNAAEAALDLKARFILVSALAVDRPKSKSFQITNTLGGNYQGIMDAKLQGEEKVRKIFSRKKDYVIIRPGVLMNGVSRNGSIDLEINQGDTIGGGLTRDELAGAIVGALISGKKGFTVEVYRRSTATPLQPNYTIPSGYESSSPTYEGLFDSVQPDSKIDI
jgi:hypothetical protein